MAFRITTSLLDKDILLVLTQEERANKFIHSSVEEDEQAGQVTVQVDDRDGHHIARNLRAARIPHLHWHDNESDYVPGCVLQCYDGTGAEPTACHETNHGGYMVVRWNPATGEPFTEDVGAVLRFSEAYDRVAELMRERSRLVPSA